MDTKAILTFLKKLSKNNNREWFEDNKEEYKAAYEEFKSGVGDILKKLSTLDPEIGMLEPKHCVYRIYRDIRFSKDKTPYKTHFGANMTRGGRNSIYAGYYIHIMPGMNVVGGGIYMPQGENLAKVRQEIDYNGDELVRMLKSAGFKRYFSGLEDLDGSKLKRAPKGYDEDNPHIEMLRHKSWIVLNRPSDSDVLKPSFVNDAFKVYKTLTPMVDFFNVALSD